MSIMIICIGLTLITCVFILASKMKYIYIWSLTWRNLNRCTCKYPLVNDNRLEISLPFWTFQYKKNRLLAVRFAIQYISNILKTKWIYEEPPSPTFFFGGGGELTNFSFQNRCYVSGLDCNLGNLVTRFCRMIIRFPLKTALNENCNYQGQIRIYCKLVVFLFNILIAIRVQ